MSARPRGTHLMTCHDDLTPNHVSGHGLETRLCRSRSISSIARLHPFHIVGNEVNDLEVHGIEALTDRFGADEKALQQSTSDMPSRIRDEARREAALLLAEVAEVAETAAADCGRLWRFVAIIRRGMLFCSVWMTSLKSSDGVCYV